MGALYCHVPFCVSRCDFCVYPVVVGAPRHEFTSYCHVAVQELEQRIARGGVVHPVESIYVGGGTPSLLSIDELAPLLDACRFPNALGAHREVTIEALLGTLSVEKASALRERGVNRVSIGVQSLDSKSLGSLGRAGQAGQVEDRLRCMVEAIRESGITNINVDLIIGLPDETDELCERLVNLVVELGVPHVSVYPLILSKKSNLYWRVLAGQVVVENSDERCRRYLRTIEQLLGEHYTRVGIAHFVRDRRFECGYHRTMWNGEDVMGIGLGAQSFVDGVYMRNTQDFAGYLRDPLRDSLAVVLSERDQVRRWIFMQLSRRLELDIDVLCNRYGEPFRDFAVALLESLAAKGFLTPDGEHVRTTDWGALNTTEMIFILGFENTEYLQQCLLRKTGCTG